MQKIAVLGAGSWGTALAILLAKKNHAVYLWSHSKEQTQNLIHDQENKKYLAGFSFPKNLKVTDQLSEALHQAQLIVIAIPSHAFREVIQQCQNLISKTTIVISGTKGLDKDRKCFLHETFREFFPDNKNFSVLSGPSFAHEVALEKPTAVVIAAQHKNLSEALCQLFQNDYFRPYHSEDVIGVEVGGAVKNILAIAVGISDGLHFGANARAALITRGIAEMRRLCIGFGGETETVFGLSGIGDLILTSTDNQSRNRRFGLLLAEGKSRAEAQTIIGQVVEGANNTELLYQLASQSQIDIPIISTMHEILNEQIKPKDAAVQLLLRELKSEF